MDVPIEKYNFKTHRSVHSHLILYLIVKFIFKVGNIKTTVDIISNMLLLLAVAS